MIESVRAMDGSFDRFLLGRRKERRHGTRSTYLQGRYLVVEFVGGAQTVPIVDADDRGLAIVSTTPLPVGGLVTFRGGPDSAAVQLFAKIQGRANVAYCRSHGEQRFLVGLEFTQVRFSSLRSRRPI